MVQIQENDQLAINSQIHTFRFSNAINIQLAAFTVDNFFCFSSATVIRRVQQFEVFCIPKGNNNNTFTIVFLILLL